MSNTPSRIISLVPSLTELLYDLGLNDEVTGITKFCVHPASWHLTKTKVGGTKTIDIPRIHQLHPDLIIANKEENVKEQVEELARHYPVWVSDINNPAQAYHAIEEIGLLTGKKEIAGEMVAQIKTNFNQLKQARRGTACYLIWRHPFMTIGCDTFIHSMLQLAGFDNIFKNQSRYPVITLHDIALQKPEWILLSSEPFPFKQKHIDEMKEQLPDAKFLLADGQMFSWYGSRMLYAPAYFLTL